MKNPYNILNVPQNATKKEIMKAVMVAMKKKEHPLNEITAAQRQLLNPEKRIAADFLFPARIKSRRLKKIKIKIQTNEINTNNINQDLFDSLNA